MEPKAMLLKCGELSVARFDDLEVSEYRHIASRAGRTAMDDQVYLNLSGKHLEYPTEEQLRGFMLDAADQFSCLTSMPLTRIGKEALNDPAFVSQIAAGRNFRVKTFDSFMSWLDQNWPAKRDKKNGSNK